METFVRRIDEAYAAKTRDELSHLTRDLPGRWAWWHRLTAWIAGNPTAEDAQSPRLRPPRIEPGSAVTLGRGPECDFIVRNATVSARHAELSRSAEGWTLRDLGSRNGTRVNGWLVEEQHLADGDEVTFGDSTFVFREPPAGSVRSER
jgi:pSer/pThr/pTyr-binding forkhead associated (FHA) protein